MKLSAAERLREKRRADHLYRRIFALLVSNEWEYRFAKLQGNRPLLKKLGFTFDIVGMTDRETGLILIDHREDILATLVHECVHALYPDMSEADVQKAEHLLVRHMGARRARRLIVFLAVLL